MASIKNDIIAGIGVNLSINEKTAKTKVRIPKNIIE